MANFNVVGFEEVEKELYNETERAKEKIPLMLNAGADILVEEHKRQIRAHGLIDTGALSKSIIKTSITNNGINSALFVRPVGRDGKGIRNAEKGFIAEYGKRGQAAKPWMTTANAISEDKIHAEMKRIWEGD